MEEDLAQNRSSQFIADFNHGECYILNVLKAVFAIQHVKLETRFVSAHYIFKNQQGTVAMCASHKRFVFGLLLCF